MATPTKAVNFTDEQATKMRNAWQALSDAKGQKALVEEFAKDFGKNVRSIVAKASNLGIYKKVERVAKTGAKIETKAQMVTRIAQKYDLSETVIGSIENASKQALLEILSIPVPENTAE